MSLQAALQRLGEALSPTQISTARLDRAAYSGDMWPRLQIAKLEGTPAEHQPSAVVWPQNVHDVSVILEICHTHRVPVVPFGAGSGVCGGTLPTRGGVMLDLRRLDRVECIDSVSLLVEVQAGIIGHHLERQLEEQGLTLGHFPSSILCSTVGGWIAARSAGQCSSLYGKIEDMVSGLEVVLASGEVLRTGCLGSGAPIDFTPLFVGSEGTLGVVTRAVLRVHPAPEHRAMRGLRFRDLESGLDFMRRVMQDDLRPAVLRLYDPLDTLLSGVAKASPPGAASAPSPARGGWLKRALDLAPASLRTAPQQWAEALQTAQGRALHAALERASWVNRAAPILSSGCKTIVGLWGERGEVNDNLVRMLAIAESCGAEDLGEGPGRHWLEHRYDVSFKQMRIYAAGAFVDTMEVATSWSRLVSTYDAVREALLSCALIMAHFSHAYADGCSIYFTFASAAPGQSSLRAHYDRVWQTALRAARSCGAAVSHHHGVGLLKRDALSESMPHAASVFFAVKKHFDPHAILNPDKVFVDPGPGRVPGGAAAAGAKGLV